MSKAPFWPVATDAMIADTTHLSAEETGAYMMLLMCLWRSNGEPLPLNHKRLARMARVRPNRWKGIWENIEEFFEIHDEQITQKRLRKDWVTVQEKITRNRKAGSKGGKAKSLKIKEQGLANASDPPEQSGNQPEPEPEERKNTKKEIGILELETMFAEWGDLYPKDVRGSKAKEEFGKALDRIAWEDLKAKTEQYAELCESEKRTARHIREAKNWLADSAWTELPEPDNPWPERMKAWKAGHWHENWGPKPDNDNTHVPEEYRHAQQT